MRNKQPAVQQSGWSRQLRVFSSIVLLDLLPLNRNVILGRLPERIKAALIARAAEIEYPISFAAAIAKRCHLFAVSSSHAGRTSINIVKFITDRRIAISGTV
jgi:hypothetical protein